jgi:hypothetical protein
MKLFGYLVFSGIVICSSISIAKVQNLNVALAAASAEEKSDLAKLLKQVTMVPTQEKKDGKTLFKVTKIEKGSIWERLGWKVGDVVSQ